VWAVGRPGVEEFFAFGMESLLNNPRIPSTNKCPKIKDSMAKGFQEKLYNLQSFGRILLLNP
jgi:hypothetical protein